MQFVPIFFILFTHFYENFGKNTDLEKGIDQPVLGGKVPDEAGPVQGHVAALGAREGDLLGQQWGHFVLK